MKNTADSVQRCYAALAELSKKEAFEKIYTSEIIAAAGISRSHFYRLFQDKYDLLDKFICNNLYTIYTQDCDLNSWNARIVAFLTLIRQHQHVLLCKYNQELLLKKYFDIFRQLFELRLQRLGNTSVSLEALQPIRFACAGIAVTIVDWLDSGCREEPELVANGIAEAISPALYKLCCE